MGEVEEKFICTMLFGTVAPSQNVLFVAPIVAVTGARSVITTLIVLVASQPPGVVTLTL